MLFIAEVIKQDDLDNARNFFVQIDNEFEAVNTVSDETSVDSPVAQYLSSLVCGQYKKAIENIENTTIGNKIKRKRNLQQVMRESFFYGANRFGNNFIA